MINCKYYNIDEIQTLVKHNCTAASSLFHINTCFLPKNIKGLEYLIDKIKTDFDIITISVSRIIKSRSPINDINSKKYSYELCPSDSLAPANLLYISDHLS